MRTQIRIWDANICLHCTRRYYCKRRDNSVTVCSGIDVSVYKCDVKVYEELKRRAMKFFDEIRGAMKRVKPSQLKLTKHMRVDFFKLPKAELKANSRKGKCVTLDALTYRKWCEQCGEAFETVNNRRKLCNACHKEICEAIGANYALPSGAEFGN